MRFNILQKTQAFYSSINEPTWSSRVPRWYQLDGAAFCLAELFSEIDFQQNFLILASPLGSNLTDWEFVQTGANRAQKFVHTLPNIRASMALQAAEKTCRFVCLQNGEETLETALQEFIELSQTGFEPGLALVELLNIDDSPQKRQFYKTSFLSHSPQGAWEVRHLDQAEGVSFNKTWESNPFEKQQDFQIGQWLMERKIET